MKVAINLLNNQSLPQVIADTGHKCYSVCVCAFSDSMPFHAKHIQSIYLLCKRRQPNTQEQWDSKNARDERRIAKENAVPW